MPIHVHCPNGCLIRMSVNRAGRVVRCPRCKSAIRIPKFSQSELNSGAPIPCYAKLAKRKGEGDQRTEQPNFEANAGGGTVENAAAHKADTIQDTPGQSFVSPEVVDPTQGSNSPLPVSEFSKPDSYFEFSPEPGSETKPHLDVPAPSFNNPKTKTDSQLPDGTDESLALSANSSSAIDSKQLQKRKEEEVELDQRQIEKDRSEQVGSGEAAAAQVDFEQAAFGKSDNDQLEKSEISLAPASPALAFPEPNSPEPAFPAMGLKERQLEESFSPQPSRRSTSTPIINLDPTAEPPVVLEEKDWGARLKSANSDRRVLAKLFAVVLCLVAVVNMIPAIYHWYYWLQLTEPMALPRWIYIQIFVGAIHLVYAIFLAQIPDWSAMRAVSIAMLAVAFVFGFISTGLLIGGGQGNLTGFLGIPYALSRQACMWCVAMLCLATLMSYWGGKESGNWQRAEHLLKDIVSRSTAQA